ncbi:GntR family transcriptional regulator [Bordetella trematum]|uniref:GntR family transcriptional regulator n=1 Tax=Bordetella trematum TaxID=123899 RepID=A0A157NSZ7_9BORD|nr:FadR/GntR family transcriptional regulator [Bordetella trematum]SAI20525.1 GntR family transcriptional regulator [Bordetella trematum]SAI24363.1 GntR family transcriptional regulator [Bordetella trematum]SAI70666.1 GntR family transcriptional regulator [Bordetella trematum]SUV98673.1 GntR family transcriptional regulator [Bordetella trematum]
MSLNDAGEFLLGGRENLPQRVSEEMLRMIRSATFKPGERLPTEPQLAATFGVSRNVVREAVATLRSKGILMTRRGIGTFVSETALYPAFEIHPDDLLEPAALMQIFQLRLEVESGAAAIAARERSAEQLEQIGSALIRVNESAPNWEQGAQKAVDFHLAIAQATNNAYFEQLMAHLRVAIHQAVRTLRYLDDGKGRTQQIESEHRAIYEAIRQSDADAARTAMRAHLQSGMYNYQRIFRERKAQ